MTSFARTDTSALGRWWWTVDRWMLGALAVIIGVGAILILAASPAVALRIGYDSLHFVKRQFVMLPPAIVVLVAVSLLSPRQIRRLSTILFVVCLGLMLVVPIIGTDIKGARRWISLAGLSLQPSEFIKPCFAVVAAWAFSEARKGAGVTAYAISIVLFAIVVGLLLMQPDLGMAVVVTAVWFTQFFLAGLPMVLVAAGSVLGGVGLVAAYFTFSHVASRINRFFDPSSGDGYQVEQAMHAFTHGGLWGRGPGEGTVKMLIPDAHADFIFAVAAEEFGLATCLVIVFLFAFVMLRGFSRLLSESNLFVLMAGTGLLTQFGLQAVINMASTLHLMPTKGMTLPFISYGGSSLVALALGMGMALALTRKRYGAGDEL